MYLEQSSIFSLLSCIWQRRSGLRQVVGLKHGVVVPEAALCTTGSHSQGTAPSWYLKEDGFTLSALLCSWHRGPLHCFCLGLLWCFHTLPVIPLSHQTGESSPKFGVAFLYLLEFIFLSICESLCRWRGGGRSTEPQQRGKSKIFPSQCWSAAKLAQ